MKTLFIGGYGDGKIIDVSGDRIYMSIPEITECVFNVKESESRNEVYNIHEYKKQMLFSGNRKFYAMVWVDEPRDIIEVLLNGYNPTAP